MARLNIPLIFYGEMPGEYGEQVSHKTSSYSKADDKLERKVIRWIILVIRMSEMLIWEAKKSGNTRMKVCHWSI